MLRRLIDSPWLYFSLAGALLIAMVLSQFEIHLPNRPVGDLEDLERLRERDDVNVVFILVDTLRADHLSAYGYERETSPTLDVLAASGVRFAHVQSQSSWTKASMASLWTGAYPRRVGIERYPDALAPEATLAAEILQQAGLYTGGVFRNGWLAANFGFSQGFDVYVQPNRPSATPRKFERHNPSSHPLQGNDFDATESALEFLRANGHRRFLLYVHYMDAHQYLYDSESGLFGSTIVDVYDNAIHWTDRNISILLRALQDRGLMDRTIVVIASDHGEAFYEHGIEGHARNLYAEVTQTPLILLLPFRLEPGVVVEAPVQNVDIWPTVLDLLGLDPLPGADGRSLVPLIEAALTGEPERAPEELRQRPTFAELDRNWGLRNSPDNPITSVTSDGYKLVRWRDQPGQKQLFERGSDPKEQRNVLEQYPEVVAELDGYLDDYLAADLVSDSKFVELDEMRMMQLRALGYVDLGKEGKGEAAQADGEAAEDAGAPASHAAQTPAPRPQATP